MPISKPDKTKKSYFLTFGFFHTTPSGMIRGITGIKNEVKRTRRSFDSPLGSALTKNLKKVLGYPIFWDPIWIQNHLKMSFFSFRYSAICKMWYKIGAHLIFFPSESWYAIHFNRKIWFPYLVPSGCLFCNKQSHSCGKLCKKSRFILA